MGERMEDGANLRVAFLGCGNMGTAVLEGLLDAFAPDEESPASFIKAFTACTKSESSASKLKSKLSSRSNASLVHVVHDATVQTMSDADVVILGFKPFMARDILSAPGVQQALEGKLVVSMLAGLSASDIKGLILKGGDQEPASGNGPYVAKVVPNIAAAYRKSMTMIERSDMALLPEKESKLTEQLFAYVGWVKWIAPEVLDTACMLMTGAIAVLSVPLEGLLDGSVSEGMKRPDAMELAIHSIQGLAALLENGAHPAVMRESMASPRGCTIKSLLTVEKASTRAVFAQSLIDGVELLKEVNKRDR